MYTRVKRINRMKLSKGLKEKFVKVFFLRGKEWGKLEGGQEKSPKEKVLKKKV